MATKTSQAANSSGPFFPSHVRPYLRQAARPILDGVKVIVMTVILLLLGKHLATAVRNGTFA